MQIKICSLGFLTDQNSTNQNMHFGIFDQPVPVKYPKRHILNFSKNWKSKYAFWDMSNCKLKFVVLDFWQTKTRQIKTCILGYLTSQHQSNIQKGIFWFSKTRKSKYAFWDTSNCKLKFVVLDFWRTKTRKSKYAFWDNWQASASQISQNTYSDFPKLENPNMYIGNLY